MIRQQKNIESYDKNEFHQTFLALRFFELNTSFKFLLTLRLTFSILHKDPINSLNSRDMLANPSSSSVSLTFLLTSAFSMFRMFIESRISLFQFKLTVFQHLFFLFNLRGITIQYNTCTRMIKGC